MAYGIAEKSKAKYKEGKQDEEEEAAGTVETMTLQLTVRPTRTSLECPSLHAGAAFDGAAPPPPQSAPARAAPLNAPLNAPLKRH